MEGADGSHESENATVVTSLSGHTVINVPTYPMNTFDLMDPLTVRSSPQDLVLRPELNCLGQGELELTRSLLENYLVPPPQPVNNIHFERNDGLGGAWGASQIGVLQDQFIDEFIFKGRVKNGFFVEAGADDFLVDSNTLLFEVFHGWTGLLVEPLFSRFKLG